jgi:phosphatidylinositol glycan class B
VNRLVGDARSRPLPWLWVLACIYTALNMYGYHYADELGQITAFCLSKVGAVPTEQLPWEYPARIRSWVQPGLYYLALAPIVARWGFDFLVAERVFILVQMALLAAALPLYLCAAPRLSTEGRRAPCWRWGLLATAGIWFVPSMLLRHSSEAFSTILLGASLGAWALGESSRGRRAGIAGFASGMLAGFACCGRFQVALFFAGFWIARAVTDLRREREALWQLLFFALGVVISLAAGIAVDRWGYGETTLAAVNYFRENIVHDKASAWGRAPWHRYLVWGGAFTVNPLVWLWLGRAAVDGWRRPFLRATAVGASAFLLAHMLVPHKEERFLVPLIAPGFLLLLHLFAGVAEGRGGAWPRWLGGLAYVRLVAIANIAALAGFTLFGLVRDRNRIDLVMRELPAGSTVFSSISLYATFDAALDTPEPAVIDYGLAVVKPPSVRFVYTRWERTRVACRAAPDGYVLLSNRERGNHLIELGYENLVWPRPPWSWLMRPKILRPSWQYKLLRCSDFIAVHSR